MLKIALASILALSLLGCGSSDEESPAEEPFVVDYSWVDRPKPTEPATQTQPADLPSADAPPPPSSTSTTPIVPAYQPETAPATSTPKYTTTSTIKVTFSWTSGDLVKTVNKGHVGCYVPPNSSSGSLSTKTEVKSFTESYFLKRQSEWNCVMSSTGTNSYSCSFGATECDEASTTSMKSNGCTYFSTTTTTICSKPIIY